MKRTLGLTLLLFATLFSCMRQEKPLPAELSRAESVMWEHPDSALLCLSSLDSSIMNEPENGSPDKPGGLSIQLCKSEKKEFYIRYSS